MWLGPCSSLAPFEVLPSLASPAGDRLCDRWEITGRQKFQVRLGPRL